ncbi:MFS transporter [Loigolactobacillus coryniformis]|uniref:MFS transporter n=1 Tax=Loigolactobacillus coryniformis TaxID=1610 RepID=A0A5B8TFG5_9LACO|nr:MFS transporter [Loigolactobacillus coryniformis]QEA52582.1 MFS transporter [Loigolactobacillus coryniformis]
MNNERKPNAGARLDRLPTSKFHWQIFGMISFGLLVSWSNAIGGLILAQLAEIGWTNNNISAIFSSLTTAGMFLGALLGGMIGDRFGRRNSYLLFVAIHIVSMIVGAFSPNMTFFIIDRVVMGFALGALLTTLFAGYTEYVPSRNRGTWSSRASFIGNWSYPICSLIAMAITPLVSANLNWRIQLVIPAILSSIAFVIVWHSFPESPRWLESQGRYEEANKILDKIESDIEYNQGKKLPEIISNNNDNEQLAQISYSDLFKGKLLKRVLLGSFVLISMNVVQYTLINWLPTIFLSQGINLKNSVLLNTMSMFGAPIGIFIATFIIDKIPRKVFGVGLLLIIAVLGYVYSLQTSMLMISLLGFFLIIFVYMYVCYASAVYVPEIWPTAAKLRGSGLANSIGRISGILAPYGVAYFLNTSGVTGVFMMLGVTAVVTAIIILVFGIETRSESVEEIGHLDTEEVTTLK